MGKLKKISRLTILIILLALLLSNYSVVASAASGGTVTGMAESSPLIYGDCNNDWNVDALDLALLKKYLLDSGHAYNKSLDLNVDNTVDSLDFAIMKLYMLGTIKILPYNPSQTAKKWVGTWAAPVQLTEVSNMPPSPGLSNNTLRQIVRVTIGGNEVRLKLSNEYGNTPVVLNSVHLAVSAGGSSIQENTDKVLLFGGNEAVTIPAGETITSDTLDFSLSKLTDMTVTIFFGSTPTALTGHPGSRTTSYIQLGNCVNSSSLSSAKTTDHWYILTGIDVYAEDECRAIVALGDSITDGRGSTTNGNNRWTDNLARRLHENTATAKVAVLNKGIGGNAVLSGGVGPTALTRFDRDILEQSGVRYLILFEGVNDIGDGASSSNLINAYKQFISQAHEKNILVYGATITAFGGSQYYSAMHEQTRQELNNWIRSSGEFDAVIDFDAAIRNPNDQKRLLSIFDSNDHLHPNAEGYKKMAEIIDINLFTK